MKRVIFFHALAVMATVGICSFVMLFVVVSATTTPTSDRADGHLMLAPWAESSDDAVVLATTSPFLGDDEGCGFRCWAKKIWRWITRVGAKFIMELGCEVLPKYIARC